MVPLGDSDAFPVCFLAFLSGMLWVLAGTVPVTRCVAGALLVRWLGRTVASGRFGGGAPVPGAEQWPAPGLQPRLAVSGSLPGLACARRY